MKRPVYLDLEFNPSRILLKIFHKQLNTFLIFCHYENIMFDYLTVIRIIICIEYNYNSVYC